MSWADQCDDKIKSALNKLHTVQKVVALKNTDLNNTDPKNTDFKPIMEPTFFSPPRPAYSRKSGEVANIFVFLCIFFITNRFTITWFHYHFPLFHHHLVSPSFTFVSPSFPLVSSPLGLTIISLSVQAEDRVGGMTNAMLEEKLFHATAALQSSLRNAEEDEAEKKNLWYLLPLTSSPFFFFFFRF